MADGLWKDTWRGALASLDLGDTGDAWKTHAGQPCGQAGKPAITFVTLVCTWILLRSPQDLAAPLAVSMVPHQKVP